MTEYIKTNDWIIGLVGILITILGIILSAFLILLKRKNKKKILFNYIKEAQINMCNKNFDEAINLYNNKVKDFINDNYSKFFYILVRINEGFMYQKLSIETNQEIYIRKAISKYEEGLQQFKDSKIKTFMRTKLKKWYMNKYSIQRAILHCNLSDSYNTYAEIREDDKFTNLAIKHANLALDILSSKKTPKYYALTHSNLAISNKRIYMKNHELEYFNKAIEYNEKALSIYKIEHKSYDYDYARVLNNLANLYKEYKSSDKGEIIKYSQLGLNCLETSLNIYTVNSYPYEYARGQNNLGTIYYKLDDHEDTLFKAINCYQKALLIFTIEKYKYNYASTNLNICYCYYSLTFKEDENSKYLTAIDYAENALKVFTIDAYPQMYAKCQLALWDIYYDLSRINDRIINLKKAIDCCEKAMQVYTKEKYPKKYSEILLHLYDLYWCLGDYYKTNKYEKLRNKYFEEAKKILNVKEVIYI